jgi:hypothetical protein
VLTRPAQKTPSSRKTAPTTWLIRRMIQGYPRAGRPRQERRDQGPPLTRQLLLPRSRARSSIGCALPQC